MVRQHNNLIKLHALVTPEIGVIFQIEIQHQKCHESTYFY